MEPVYIMVRIVLVSVLRVLYRFRTFGLENVPATGPVIVAPNHISNFDPFCVAYLVDHIMRRRTRFLGKASLWRKWYLRIIMENAGQIPVERGSGNISPMHAAEAALRKGETVVVYPEGTITTNLDLTPMRGKTGVARLGLATGAPVIPVAVWGAQWMLGKGREWKYRGHRDVYFKIGEPMFFPEYEGRENDVEVLHAISDRVMGEIDRLVRDLHEEHPDRGAVPPLKDESRGLRSVLGRITKR